MAKTPKRKKIKDMTPEEARQLTDDEVIEKLFGKRAAKKLKEAVSDDSEKRNED